MATLVILEATAKEGATRSLLDLLARLLPETRGFAGCREVDMYLNEDGRTVALIERWDAKADYQQYLGWREETGVLAALAELLDGPPVIRFFEPVGA